MKEGGVSVGGFICGPISGDLSEEAKAQFSRNSVLSHDAQPSSFIRWPRLPKCIHRVSDAPLHRCSQRSRAGASKMRGSLGMGMCCWSSEESRSIKSVRVTQQLLLFSIRTSSRGYLWLSLKGLAGIFNRGLEHVTPLAATMICTLAPMLFTAFLQLPSHAWLGSSPPLPWQMAVSSWGPERAMPWRFQKSCSRSAWLT